MRNIIFKMFVGSDRNGHNTLLYKSELRSALPENGSRQDFSVGDSILADFSSIEVSMVIDDPAESAACVILQRITVPYGSYAEAINKLNKLGWGGPGAPTTESEENGK